MASEKRGRPDCNKPSVTGNDWPGGPSSVPDPHEPGGRTPYQEYTRRLEARQAQARRLRLRHQLISRVRNALFGVIVFQVLLTERERAIVFCTLLALPAFSFMSLVVWRNRLNLAIHRALLAADFYERRLRCLTDSWAERGEAGTRYIEDSHPCAVDLDLFGPGCLFELLCTACTRWGQDTLAAWLRCPADEDEIRARQEAVAELRSQLDAREELAVRAGEVRSPERFAVWVVDPEAVSTGVSTVTHGISGALALLCLTTFLAWIWGVLAPFPFLAFLLAERGRAWSIRRKLPHLPALVWQPRRELAALAALLERLERIESASDRVSRLRMALRDSDHPCSRRLTRLRYLLALAPLASLSFWGMPLALAVESWRRRHGRSVGRWLAALGEWEALCALAAYAFENPSDPFPEIDAERPCFDAEDLGHPLLPRARCVRNDVRLGDEPRVLIVSGSNMSGKSTFLRTVGINAVLARMGATVRARRLRISPLVVGATLRVQDSLQAGRSRFYAEVLRVRQLLDLAKQSPPLLFLLDELFQGTNSQDRRVGAEAVLRILVDSGAIGMVTTHDLALTEIADRFGPLAANVHFEDRYQDGAMVFDYRLRPGVVRSSNGLALLRAVGIEV
jgi:hypothetical protein